MQIIDPSFSFLQEIDGVAMVRRIEAIGRVCYKSEGKITEDSYRKFLSGIIARGHESVIEHEKVTVRLICDRGVTHELVRHRLASYSQESTRYCNYTQDRFGGELTFIRPFFWDTDSEKYRIWKEAMEAAERSYFRLIELGATPQEARSILPNSLKTEIVVTMDLREWRHFFSLRCAASAHPQIRQVAIPLLEAFREKIPVLFDDIRTD
ncbi:MAG: FAD-dependent thymidylate synthase [Oscillospiraceae bacterium]|nr:FAD-dependent thymidylate synthase [Oscillospiraceae bacterium]